MDKSSRIEFAFNSEEFKHYYNQSYDWIIEKIHLSVHSSQSVFKTGDFHPINITNRMINYFEFSEYFVKSLKWPHETNCKSNEIELKSENELIYSFDDCVNSCIFDKTYGKYKCIQIEDSFKIDLILENKTRDLTFCNENNTKEIDLNKLEIFCLRTCQQNCINEFIKIYPYEKHEFSNKSVVIQSANFPLLEYEMNSKFSLFKYASNLGGIMSMWFGFAVIDIHMILKQFIAILSKIFQKIITTLNSIEIFQNLFIQQIIYLFIFINNYISIFFLKVQKINLKLLFKIFCLICFFYQSFELTSDYLLFKTFIEVKSENNVKDGYIDSFPAISFCTENKSFNKSEKIILYSNLKGEDMIIKQVFKDCAFDREYNSSDFSRGTKSCGIIYGKFVEVLDNISVVSIYLNSIDLKYYHYICEYNDNFECKEFGLITSHSKDLECFTFMSKLSKKFNSSFKFDEDSYYSLNSERIPKKGYMFVHDSNQLPSFPKSKLSSLPLESLSMQSIHIFYEKKLFKLLPAPYETDCYEYSGNIKSQAQCLNEVLFKGFLRNNCLPKSDDMLTFVINNKNYVEFDYRFCKNNTFEMRNKSLILSLNNCRKACNEEIYEIWYSNEKFGDFELRSISLKYIAFEHKPGMKFNEYLVNIGGLLGLWHGLSLLNLKSLIIKLIRKIFYFKCKIENYRKYFTIFKIPKKIRTYLTLQVNY
jgi:hypothetical protein